jgi:hypothetical protein
MRSLIVVTIFFLTSTPAFACVFKTDCNPGATCEDGVCSDARALSNDAQDSAPKKQEAAPTWKTCFDDSDCSAGSKCLKGSGLKGACIGH